MEIITYDDLYHMAPALTEDDKYYFSKMGVKTDQCKVMMGSSGRRVKVVKGTEWGLKYGGRR